MILFAFSLCDNNPHGNGGGGTQAAGRRGQHCTGEIRSVRTAGLCTSLKAISYISWECYLYSTVHDPSGGVDVSV